MDGPTDDRQQLETAGPNKDFWAALSLVCKDELAKAGALPGKDALTGGGVHAAVAEELEGMWVERLCLLLVEGWKGPAACFLRLSPSRLAVPHNDDDDDTRRNETNQPTDRFGGKSLAALGTMREEIQARVRSGEEGVDVDYWENVLAELKVQCSVEVEVEGWGRGVSVCLGY